MITIAIDPSTKCTGYSVFKDSKLIDYGAFSEESKNTTERVFNILTKVEELIKKHEPTNMAVEDVQITMNAKTAKALLGLQFSIELLAYKYNIKCSLLHPTSWRKILGLSNSRTLDRAAKKQETISYVENKYQIKIEKDDISDAIAIGTAFIENAKK